MITSKCTNVVIGVSFVVVAFIAAVYFVTFGVAFNQNLSKDTSDWAEFGSFFGGIAGPILSFLAFAILAKTFQIQDGLKSKQLAEFERQRRLSEVELTIDNLEKLDREFSLLINTKAVKLQERTILDVLGRSVSDRERKDEAVVESAKTVLQTLTFISFFVNQAIDKQKKYYGYKDQHLSLAYGQIWRLKYSMLCTNCLEIAPQDTLKIEEKLQLSALVDENILDRYL